MRRVQRHKRKVSEAFGNLFVDEFEALKTFADPSQIVADTWEKLGPPPEVISEKSRAANFPG